MSNAAQTQPSSAEAVPASVIALVETVASIATEAGRDDLADRLAIAVARIRRPATIVCVVGEFKQGKSSLVNALLGRDVCPVDDDIATSAITLVRHGAELTVEVRRRVDDNVIVERVPPSSVAEWVSERGNPDNIRGVERVDIAMPHPLLAHGLVIVDTPGMGGLGAGHAAATLAFLPFADGLVFVTDASAELSQPEAEFLDRAGELCPNVVFALTKIDLYPAWRQIATIDAGRRSARDHDFSDDPIMPVSSVRSDDFAGPDEFDEAADASGIPALLQTLDQRVIQPATTLAAERATREAVGVLDQLNEQLRTELDVLNDPSRLGEVSSRLSAATSHLEQLRGPGSRWSLLVADRISDLSNNSSFQFRKAMRTVSRDMEEAIELLKTPEDWDQLARRLQTDVADSVTDVFVNIEREAEATRAAAVELIGEDVADLTPMAGRRGRTELASLWADKELDPASSRAGRPLSSALVGLRGAQSGIIMFGMMGRFLPAGAAALMLSNPVTVGIGAVFAGMQLADAHKRKIALRRQQARSNVRQFLDEVQFAITNEIGEVMRDVQRSIRDEFTERIAELIRTYTDAAQQSQHAVQCESEGARGRSLVVQSALDRIGQARAAIS
jgi:GTPase Era involved in 16S rRNA processing